MAALVHGISFGTKRKAKLGYSNWLIVHSSWYMEDEGIPILFRMGTSNAAHQTRITLKGFNKIKAHISTHAI